MQVIIDGVPYAPMLQVPIGVLDFGELLTYYKAQTRETWEEMADRFGMAKSRIWELAHSEVLPSFEVILTIARYSHLTVEQLAAAATLTISRRTE